MGNAKLSKLAGNGNDRFAMNVRDSRSRPLDLSDCQRWFVHPTANVTAVNDAAWPAPLSASPSPPATAWTPSGSGCTSPSSGSSAAILVRQVLHADGQVLYCTASMLR